MTSLRKQVKNLKKQQPLGIQVLNEKDSVVRWLNQAPLPEPENYDEVYSKKQLKILLFILKRLLFLARAYAKRAYNWQ